MHNDLMLGPSWPEQPHTYELLIRVADAGPSTPHLSTTATVIVHLVPWRASTVATSTHRATVRGVLRPLVGGKKGSWRMQGPSFPGGTVGEGISEGTAECKEPGNTEEKSGVWGGPVLGGF